LAEESVVDVGDELQELDPNNAVLEPKPGDFAV
jgi:hypothetical protein